MSENCHSNICEICGFEKDSGKGMIMKIIDGVERWKQCECTKKTIKESRLSFAQIPDAFKYLTINSFNVNLYINPVERKKASMAKRMCSTYIKNFDRYKQQGKGLYLHSETKGSGKTRMAMSIANALINHVGVSVRIINTLDLFDEIKKTYSKDSDTIESEIIEEVKTVEVIIFDDIGVEKPTSWVREKLYHILNYRGDNNSVTIFTSNCKQEELDLGDRITSRIIKMSVPINFPEESIRKSLAQEENLKIQNELLDN